jgi:hypothetical protein
LRIGSAKLGGDFPTFKFNVLAQPVLSDAAGRIATLGRQSGKERGSNAARVLPLHDGSLTLQPVAYCVAT